MKKTLYGLVIICCLLVAGCMPVDGYPSAVPTYFPGMFGSLRQPDYDQFDPYAGYGINRNDTFWQESAAQVELDNMAIQRFDGIIQDIRNQRRNILFK